MKKAILALAVIVALAVAATVYAFPTGGEFASDKFGGTGLTGRFTPNLAPTGCIVTNVGTKGKVNLSTKNLTQYKFWFQKATDYTSIVGKARFGTFSSAKEADAFYTAGDTFVVGNGVKNMGFATFSTATKTLFTYCPQ